MWALMNDDGTLNRVTSEERVEWGGAYHSCLRLMLPSERQKFRIWEFAEDGGTPGLDGVQAGEHFEVNAKERKVTRTQLWRQRTKEEKAQRVQAKAQADLDVSDKGVARIVDDLVAALIAKGVIKVDDLPAAAKAKLDARQALRAEISKEIVEG